MGRKSRRKKRRNAFYDYSSQEGASPKSEEAEFVVKKKMPKEDTFARILLWIIRLGAYAALFAPLVVHPNFFFPFVVPKTVFFWVFTEIIFAAWLLLAISNKQFRPRWNALTISVLIFLFVTILTSFTGINIERSFWSTFERMAGTVNWIHFTLFFIVLSSTFRSIGDWKKLLTTSLIASTAVSIIFLLQKYGVEVIPFNTKSGATIGNSSFMAAYLLFNVFFGIWLLLIGRGYWQKALYALSLALLIFAVIVSTAFGALLAMFGGLFIIFLFWLFFLKKIKFGRATASALLVVSMVVGGIVLWGTFTQNEAILSKLPSFFSTRGALGSRKVIWNIALEGVKDRPVLGWGPESFNVVFTKYFNPCLPLSECGGEIWFDRTHNIFLDNLINSGAIGLLSYLAIFVSALFILWRNFLHTRDDPSPGSHWVVPAVVVAVLASYFVQNFLVFDMLNTFLMFSFTLAFIGGMVGAGKQAKGERLVNPNPAFSFIVVVFLVYYLFSFGFQSLQSAHWGVVLNHGGLSPQERIDLLDKSLSTTPLGNRQTVEFVTNNVTSAITSGQDVPKDFVYKVGETMSGLAEKNEIDFRHYLLLGNFYTAARSYDPSYFGKAREALVKATELGPTNQFGYISLSQVYLLAGDFTGAVSSIEKAIELKPEYGRTHHILGEIYKVAGNAEKSTASFKKAKELGYNPR